MSVVNQAVRYILAGLGSNLFLYVLYLGATSLGLGHKLAMTGVYTFGVVLTYFLHRNWSFMHQGEVSASSIRYVICYISGYMLNLFLMYMFVDRLGLPHQIVQLVLVLIVAGYLFLVMKFWVFRSLSTPDLMPTRVSGP